jgi:[ribosomal protein S18]-alanine N-acetyltransferase
MNDLTFEIRPTDEVDAREIASWRYEPPYELYNANPGEMEEHVNWFADPTNGYYSVRDVQGRLIAYICLGEDARVAGGDYSGEALDVGCGIKPDLTGRGLGPRIIQAAVDLGDDMYHPHCFRATIAAFNERALKAAQKVGFARVGTFERPPDGRPFVILEHEASRSEQSS